SGSVIRRPNGADNFRRSDSIRNNCRADQRSLNYRGAKRGITAASAAGFRARTRPPGTEFLDAETGPQISSPKCVSAHRDKNPEMSGRKSPQKRPIWRRAGNARFARTGLKLVTHHPVIEPVSEIRVRNGIFRCRERKPNPPFCPAETEAETGAKSKKPAVRGPNARSTRGVR